MNMTSKPLHQNVFAAVLVAIAMSFAISASAADEGVHPVDETKKVAKEVGHGVKKTTTAIGHGFRDGARAVGHGARKVTRDVGHAFRDGAHKVTGKKEKEKD
ncbi:hypothetical protein [Duganella hordei]|jgi:hypothetical protein|uniref:hypothetical protein n=1 Tax=Duganella hordei TaxID=2865934 RepID=UPI0030E85D75